VVTNGEQVQMSKLPQPLVKTPQFELESLECQVVNPAAEIIGTDASVAVPALQILGDAKSFSENCLLPNSVNRLGEEGLKHEERNEPPAGCHSAQGHRRLL
jgi:hypothetical protein